MSKIIKKEILDFQKIIWNFYRKNKRDLPWRNTLNPYEILISEIMLQQTQVPRVLSKYLEWLRKFPDFESLSSASQSEVLKLWNGLGYNRRALSLHKLSKEVVEKHEEILPLDVIELKKLPGIGEYTANAIYVFSTNIFKPFIETNIRTVYLHYFFKEDNQVNDKDIFPLIEQTGDKENSREWYYALMDHGNWIKREFGNPNLKSKSYARQSTFHGSKRQLRGRILKELTLKKELKITQIQSYSQRSREEVEEIVYDMVREGFIAYDNGDIVLKE